MRFGDDIIIFFRTPVALSWHSFNSETTIIFHSISERLSFSWNIYYSTPNIQKVITWLSLSFQFPQEREFVGGLRTHLSLLDVLDRRCILILVPWDHNGSWPSLATSVSMQTQISPRVHGRIDHERPPLWPCLLIMFFVWLFISFQGLAPILFLEFS